MAAAPKTPKARVAVGRSEHVSLESDISETRAKPDPAKPLATYELSNGSRRATTRVAILRDQFALIETWRSRSSTDEHIVDLRFVEPRVFRVRRIPWRALYAVIGVALLSALAITLQVTRPNLAQKIGGALTPIGLCAAALAGFALCYFLTTESVLFLSVHGRARLIVISGRLGTLRRAQGCVTDLIAHIKIAQKQFKQSRQAQLRDEMREHSRLYEQRALSQEEYDEAKRRILKAHA